MKLVEKEEKDTTSDSLNPLSAIKIKTRISFSKEVMRLPWYGPGVISGERVIWSTLGSGLCLAAFSLITFVTGLWALFASLGPSSYLAFSMPLARPSRIKNTIGGHAIGALVGWFVVTFITGPVTFKPTPTLSMALTVAVACFLAIGICNLLMILTDTDHPPCQATTLLFVFGVLRGLFEVGVVIASATFLAFFAFIWNRMAKIDYPIR
jgi:CBS-domain-containing membrane protein